MENLKELNFEEKVNYNGGDGGGFWYSLGETIGNWLGDWSTSDGTKCGCYDECDIIGSACNNYIS